MFRRTLFLAAYLFIVMPSWATDTPRVVVSLAPIHSLVTGVMEGIAEPELLVSGGSSPHSYMLKPSQVRSLQKADLIIWVGESVEGFLVRPLANIGDTKKIVELMDVKDMYLLGAREGGEWRQHDEHADDEHHAHGEIDGHLWLDPRNAQIIVMELADQLSRLDAEHAATYQANSKKLQQALHSLDQQLAQILAPVRETPFLVFHDAYHYFEKRYQLNSVGAVMVDPEHKPGAKRLKTLRQRIAAEQVQCIFSEPQFVNKLVQVITEGAKLKSAALDPMGVSLSPGKSLYFKLMSKLGQDLAECLGAGI